MPQRELKHPIVPIAASAVGFAGVHAALRYGPPYHSLKRMYQRRIESGVVSDRQSAATLASQAEARILNEVHNVIVLPLAITFLWRGGMNDFHAASALGAAFTLISVGYFACDLSVIATHMHEHGIEPLVHALICISFFGWSAYTGKMQKFGARVLLFELSTPFVHLRWLLHSMGLSHTNLYKVNGLVMVAVFFVSRVLWGSKLVFDIWDMSAKYLQRAIKPMNAISRPTLWVIRILGTSITVLNYFWFSKMARGAYKVFFRRNK